MCTVQTTNELVRESNNLEQKTISENEKPEPISVQTNGNGHTDHENKEQANVEMKPSSPISLVPQKLPVETPELLNNKVNGIKIAIKRPLSPSATSETQVKKIKEANVSFLH